MKTKPSIQDEFSHLPTANARWKARAKRDGKCLRCGEPAINKAYCLDCGKKQSERMRIYNEGRRKSSRIAFTKPITREKPKLPNEQMNLNEDNDLAEPLTRVVCAAIRHHTCGTVIAGVRHYDNTMRAVILRIHSQHPLEQRVEIARKFGWYDCEQGFVTNNYEFLTRSQAWVVALAAKQIRPHPSTTPGSLHSEDLY